MRTLLAISPHLDDAVFSAGAELARRTAAGWRVIVVTCFTGNVAEPNGFALACQLDKGLGPEVDYMALRREEDAKACAALGAEHIHLPFLEAPHRGYEDATALFGAPLNEPDLEERLAEALSDLAGVVEPEQIMAAVAIGGHVDHRLVLRLVERVVAAPVTFWADLPYAARSSWDRAGFEPRPCGTELAAKREAALCYESQSGFQFARWDGIDDGLAVNGAEWFRPFS